MGKKDGGKYLEQVYSAKNEQEVRAVYDRWADEYDKHVQQFGYRIPAVLMGLFGRYVAAGNGLVLDAGAGTGILGEAMDCLNYGSLTALDLSQGMLNQAQCKGVYGSCVQAALGGELPFDDDYFSAVISGGTFTEGHAPPESFDELIRITQPGGRLVFTVLVKVYENGGFKEKQAALVDQNHWRLLEMTPEFQSMPLESPEVKNRGFVYEVTK